MDLDKTNIRKIIIYLVILLSITILFLLIIKLYTKPETTLKRISLNANKELRLKEYKCEVINDSIRKDIDSRNIDNYFKKCSFCNLFEKEKILINIFFKDSLIYWSDNREIIDKNLYKFNKNKPLIKLGNAWYETVKTNYKNYKIYLLILVKNNYDYENEFLDNDFNKDLKIPYNIELSEIKAKYNVFNKDSVFLFSLNYKSNWVSNTCRNITALLQLLILTILCLLLFYINKLYIRKELLAWGILIIEILIIRYINIIYRIPATLYDLYIFSPEVYGESFILPSLGDLLINAILVFTLSILLFKKIRVNRAFIKFRESKNTLKNIIIILVVFVLLTNIIYIIKSLIINSNITFNLNNILDYSIFQIVSLIIISLLIITYFIISFSLLKYFTTKLTTKELILYFTICSLIFLFIINRILGGYNVYLLIIPMFLLISYKYFDLHNFYIISIYTIIFSLLTLHLINKYDKIKEKEERELIAERLSQEGDPQLEYLFNNLKDKIQKDTYLKNITITITDENRDEEIKTYLNKNYFGGFWLKYNIQITLCDKDDSLEVKPENVMTDCRDFFDKIIKSECKSTSCSDLYFRTNETASNSYISEIKILQNDKTYFEMYVELDNKYVPKEAGYPKLLIDKKLNLKYDYSNYSYAKYKNNELVYQYGKFPYNIKLNENNINNINEYIFINKDGFNHLYFRVNKATLIIVSKENKETLAIMGPLSFLIIFTSLIFFIYYIILNKDRFNIRNLTFKKRLQLLIISSFLISFIIIGYFSIVYIKNLNKKKNLEYLIEKSHSILIEVESKLFREKSINYNYLGYLSDNLINLSNTYFTDINIYDTKGDIISTSRSKIFQSGLVSYKMNSKAYSIMRNKEKTRLIQNENIGTLNYYSAYYPIRNFENNIIGYLNIPYFAKQDEYKNEISGYITTFLNIYIVLLIIGIIIALLLSNYITYPLELIQEKFRKIKLGEINEKIVWNRNDEIGNLIKEYNKMTDKLKESAELLAKSERELAWKEIAKQIAHEIKNPLTPMKLNVQYLLKSIEDKVELNEEKIIRIMNSLIVQIDTLSAVANEFSDLAKTATINKDKVDLNKIIEYTIELFKGNENIGISLLNEEKESFVNFDNKQLIRIFNNLIKNSIQSIDKTGQGLIKITINKDNSRYLIQIQDNGKGMSDEEKKKIFTPYFTTKSGGSGLGLAIVKNLIELSDGKIWFESAIGEGTSFFIEIPEYN